MPGSSDSAKRSRAQKAVAKLREAGLVKEMRAKAGAPIWRRDEGTGHTHTFKLTAAGVNAIAVDETALPRERRNRTQTKRSPQPIRSPNPVLTPQQWTGPIARRRRPMPMSPRSGTKIAEVIELLQREDGATLTELAVTTGWLTHTTRAALTGLRKRGYAIAVDRTNKLRGSVYWIELMEMSSDS